MLFSVVFLLSLSVSALVAEAATDGLDHSAGALPPISLVKEGNTPVIQTTILPPVKTDKTPVSETSVQPLVNGKETQTSTKDPEVSRLEAEQDVLRKMLSEAIEKLKQMVIGTPEPTTLAPTTPKTSEASPSTSTSSPATSTTTVTTTTTSQTPVKIPGIAVGSPVEKPRRATQLDVQLSKFWDIMRDNENAINDSEFLKHLLHL